MYNYAYGKDGIRGVKVQPIWQTTIRVAAKLGNTHLFVVEEH